MFHDETESRRAEHDSLTSHVFSLLMNRGEPSALFCPMGAAFGRRLAEESPSSVVGEKSVALNCGHPSLFYDIVRWDSLSLLSSPWRAAKRGREGLSHGIFANRSQREDKGGKVGTDVRTHAFDDSGCDVMWHFEIPSSSHFKELLQVEQLEIGMG